MQVYDPKQPLIYVHVPKTAGISVRQVFEKWFPKQLRRNYFNEKEGRLPRKLNLDDAIWEASPPVIYGHFNRKRGFGIEQYYPSVRQCVTLLRDPFEMHLSRYFFTLKRASEWKGGSDVDGASLIQHVRDGHLNMLEHFPRTVTADNYRDIIDEFFIHVGTVEKLQDNLTKLAATLGKPLQPEDIPHLNATQRPDDIPASLREDFREKWRLEYDVYDYVRSLER